MSRAELRAIIGAPDTNGRAASGAGSTQYAVTFTDDKIPKLVLPDTPAHDDPAGLCAWLTSVLRLDPQHPITGAVRQGVAGPEGHVEIRRAGAPPIRFEPIAAIYSPRRLFPMLDSQLLETDGEPYGFKEEHTRRIAYVVRLLTGLAEGLTAEQETAGVIGTFLSAATPLEGHTTYGDTTERYAAAMALRHDTDEHTGRPIGAARYLIDRNTGELVIRVGDLQAAARIHVGSTLPHGWLDGRINSIGWQRCRLQGYALPGRDGRRGLHVRLDVYRGLVTSDDEPVNT